MPRKESPALTSVESVGFAERRRASEDALVKSMERFGSHVLKRRRKHALAAAQAAQTDVPGLSMGEADKEKIRAGFKRLAEAAG